MAATSDAGRLGLLLCICGAWPAQAALWVPSETGGSIGYTYREYSTETDFETVSNQLTANIHGSAYIWQPWFVTSHYALALTEDRSESDSGGGTVTTEGSVVSGELGFNLLPLSRFPFSINYKRSDSRNETLSDNSNPLISDNTMQQYTHSSLSLTQGYYGDRYRINLRYGENETKREDGATYNQESYGADYSFRAPKQHLSANYLHTTQSNSLDTQQSDNDVATINHRYYPSSNFNLDSMASHVQTSTAFNSTEDYTTTINQATANAMWRSSSRDLRANFGARVQQMELLRNTQELENKGVYTNAGVSYGISKNSRFSAAARFNQTESNGTIIHASGANANLSYSGDQREIGKFSYGWGGNVGVGYEGSDESESHTRSLSLSHHASRSWQPGRRTSIRLGLNQGYGAEAIDPGGLLTQRLEHSLNLGLTTSGASSRSHAQLTISDRRSFSGEESFNQFLNLQLSRQQALSRHSSLNGNITYQQNHNYIEGMPDYGVGSSTSASLGYQLSRPFSLQHVTFTSDIRANESRPAAGVETREVLWDSTLKHTIGKLHTTLTLTLRDDDTIRSSLITLNVKRVF